jgi:hypothetical protein
VAKSRSAGVRACEFWRRLAASSFGGKFARAWAWRRDGAGTRSRGRPRYVEARLQTHVLGENLRGRLHKKSLSPFRAFLPLMRRYDDNQYDVGRREP